MQKTFVRLMKKWLKIIFVAQEFSPGSKPHFDVEIFIEIWFQKIED